MTVLLSDDMTVAGGRHRGRCSSVVPGFSGLTRFQASRGWGGGTFWSMHLSMVILPPPSLPPPPRFLEGLRGPLPAAPNDAEGDDCEAAFDRWAPPLREDVEGGEGSGRVRKDGLKVVGTRLGLARKTPPPAPPPRAAPLLPSCPPPPSSLPSFPPLPSTFLPDSCPLRFDGAASCACACLGACSQRSSSRSPSRHNRPAERPKGGARQSSICTAAPPAWPSEPSPSPFICVARVPRSKLAR